MATSKKPAATKTAPDPEADKGLRVLQFESQNVKRLELVQFKLDGKGGLVIIGGDNGAGKSSVIDSLLYALGGKKAVPKGTKVLREGEVEGHVRIDLGTIVLNRRWTAEGTDSVTITTQDGHALKDTTAIFESLGGDLVFDPLALLSMKPQDRRATLLKLADLPFNLDDKDAEYDRLFTERTDVNRQLKSAKAVVENAQSEIGGVDMDGPDLEAALAQRSEATQWAERLGNLRGFVDNANERVTKKAKEIEELERQLGNRRAELTEAEEGRAEAARRFKEHNTDGEPDFDALDHDVANARLRQQQSAAIAERDRMSETANGLAEDSKRLTTELEAITEQKATALREAKMPVDGLGFDENDVTYNGLPFAQASGAEQLRVAIAIAMAKNPTARIILSKDGSLLDKRNLAVLDEMTKGKGYQLFIERVGDGDAGAIVIEAGKVRG